VDELKANMLGWKTQTFRDVSVVQTRTTGAAEGIWRDYVKNGVANYVVGYHPLFMALKCVKRLREKPYGLVALALAFGFITAHLGRTKRIDDSALLRYIRRQQMNRLLGLPSLWTDRTLAQAEA
jgi:hypothetical protein